MDKKSILKLIADETAEIKEKQKSGGINEWENGRLTGELEVYNVFKKIIEDLEV